jgi:hypothetical protein
MRRHQSVAKKLQISWKKAGVFLRYAKETGHGCMTCPACFDTYSELRNHLVRMEYSNGKKKNKCFYGVERLNNEKEDFVSRLNTKRQEMKKNEVAEFKDTHVLYEEMTQTQQQEYIKLLRLTLLQIPTKRKSSPSSSKSN